MTSFNSHNKPSNLAIDSFNNTNSSTTQTVRHSHTQKNALATGS
ncbi:hypothetical protein CKA32_006743 [Geitlerinema sp. FC II]|nr:hypothetical protein CKA32_006743 [Geitlerinema sp. FC II]